MIIISTVLLICILSSTVFAEVNSSPIKYGSLTLGTIYANRKTSSIYAEVVASTFGTYSTDYVSVCINGYPAVTNIGSEHTTACVAVSGQFSYPIYIYGVIKRGSITATGTIIASIN